MVSADIGIIGGSGFYDLVSDLKEVKIDTPYGFPSDKLAVGRIHNKQVVFLPRHGKKHSIPPHRINYQANLWALKSLGVKEIITTTASGSLQPHLKPGDFVIIDQFIDRTYGRKDTFYHGPKVIHVSSAYPYCLRLGKKIHKLGKKLEFPIHFGGTVVVINGPRFSSVAESRWFTQNGWSLANMTQYPEVILARELEMCYAAIGFVTDYDAGLVGGSDVEPVSSKMVREFFKKNQDKLKKLLLELIKNWPKDRSCSCQKSLETAGL